MVSYNYQPARGVSRTALKTWRRIWMFLRQTAMTVLACVWLSPSLATVAADSLEEARAAYQQQQYEQALKLLDPVIGNGVGPPGALELRVRTYLKLGQTDKAVEDYLRCADHRGKDDAALSRELLHDPAALVRVDVLRALGESGNQGLMPAIEPLLRDEQPRVKAAAGAALVALGRSEALPGVLELVKHPKPDERVAVLSILGHLKDSRVDSALFSALSDREAAVRATAAGVLAERKGAGGAAALSLLLKDPVPRGR